MKNTILIKVLSGLFVAFSFYFCGKAGQPVTTTSALQASAITDIKGSITNQVDNPSDMSGWIVALVNQKNLKTRISEVDALGSYTMPHIATNDYYGIYLLSPTYVLQSVFAYPVKEKPTYVQSYFTIKGSQIPPLIQKGPLTIMQNTNGITFSKILASDVNGDGSPDGATSFMLTKPQQEFDFHSKFSLADVKTDSDKDGISNFMDSDIDGDGIMNVFDTDDDGDGVFDVADEDSDGDLVLDITEDTFDLYFKTGVYWIFIKFKMVAQEDGSFEKTISFILKIRDKEEDGTLVTKIPESIQIRGALALLKSAKVRHTDSKGKSIDQAFDGLLLDDGESEDGNANDGIFARKIYLDPAQSPLHNQVLFFDLYYKDGATTYADSFPYTFPSMKLQSATPSYESVTRTVVLQGNPFGEIQKFNWSVSVYEVLDSAKNQQVYTSGENPGDDRTFILPDNILEKGKAYKYKVISQIPERILGYSPYTIESKLFDLVKIAKKKK